MYIDGTVIAVPTAKKDAYREHAQQAAAVFRKHGATGLVECWGDDVPKGKLTDFHRAVLATDNETIVFSWITWPDRETRNAAMPKVMAEMDGEGGMMGEMPFDGKRMIYGGFEAILEA